MKIIIQIICILVGVYLLIVILGEIWTQIRFRTSNRGAMTGDALGQYGDLRIKDRIWLSGGYDEAKWLSGTPGYFGTVHSYIPGQNETPAAVIKLDQKITVEDVTGDILVLELRWEGAKWGEQGVVHIELCDFIPEPKSWRERKQGKWVESHASYTKRGH